jgi:beta-lactam-binding protein with PASTA domain/predicted Ser/Thr protein kinase
MSRNPPRRAARSAGRTSRRVPQTLARRYQIVRRVGVGGMADVYLAEDTQLGREVALKILHPQYAGDEQFVERFKREALSAAKLQHPNIVQIYDSGKEGDFNFIVMEYVEGRSLKDYLAEEGPLEIKDAARIAGEVLTALAYAHRTGLVHRDIKPGNIMMSDDGKVQVTDFGIARAEAGSTMTQTGTILGTAYYLSPEQAQGLPLDGRSDIYSLGVVLYEMLSGRRPFEGDSPVSIAYKHVRENPRPPSAFRSDIPRPLEAIVLNSLAKRPEDRYSSAALMRRDLEAFAAGKEVTATLKVAAVDDGTQVIRTVGMFDRQAVRRPGGLVALAIALLIGGLALGTWSLVTLLRTTVGRVEVPNIVEREPDQANRMLRAAGLDPSFQKDEPHPTIAQGLITRQEPPAGRNVAKNSLVKYWVSSGRPIVKGGVPNVIGKTVAEAAAILRESGLKVGTQTKEFSEKPEGEVLGQNPAPEREIRSGDTVDLVVSGGEETEKVPDVVGLDEIRAVEVLANAGFRVSRLSEPNPAEKGEVFDQDPKPGTEEKLGATVSIFISEGPQQFSMPDVRGMEEEDAVDELESRGLEVRVVREFTGVEDQRGIVIDQSPSPGTTVEQGDEVEITVGDG